MSNKSRVKQLESKLTPKPTKKAYKPFTIQWVDAEAEGRLHEPPHPGKHYHDTVNNIWLSDEEYRALKPKDKKHVCYVITWDDGDNDD